MRACKNGGPPPLPFSGREERPPQWEGRREASYPPVFGRGGASGVQASGPRPLPGSRLGAAHLRTGGEEECTGTADTNPGCNYLVRGYSPLCIISEEVTCPIFHLPSLFRRAERSAAACWHVTSVGPIRGARACRAAAVPRPPRPAHRRPPRA